MNTNWIIRLLDPAKKSGFVLFFFFYFGHCCWWRQSLYIAIFFYLVNFTLLFLVSLINDAVYFEQNTVLVLRTSLHAITDSVLIPNTCATSPPTNGAAVRTSPTFIWPSAVSILLVLLFIRLHYINTGWFSVLPGNWTVLCSVFPSLPLLLHQ